jgi:hypothetical protein
MLKERFNRNHLENHQKPRYLFKYYVTGAGAFPLDMLRYDECWPIDGHTVDCQERRCVYMQSYREPTIDRWSSFGWSVSADRFPL